MEKTVRHLWLFLSLFLILCSLSACIRLAGSAGYWTADDEGQASAKQVGFDTADYLPGPAPGSLERADQS